MSDLISRAAALEALDEINAEIEDGDGFDFEKWREFFCDMPSAQTYTDEEIRKMQDIEQAMLDKAYECGKKDAQQWIPCSERLPEHGGRYLISVLDGINRRTTVAPYLPRCKAWTMTGRMAYLKVIAWMPLPEPAKLGGN